MSWISGIASIVQTGLGVYSALSGSESVESTAETNAALVQQNAESNAALSRYDASVAELEAFRADWRTGVEVGAHMDAVERLLGNQRARLGKSGVALGKGSTQNILNETAAAGAKDAEMIIYNGMTAVENAKSAAKRYRMLADAGLRDAAAHATVITEAAADKSQAYRMNAIASGMQGLYDIGDDFGWWE